MEHVLGQKIIQLQETVLAMIHTEHVNKFMEHANQPLAIHMEYVSQAALLLMEHVSYQPHMELAVLQHHMEHA